MARSRILKLLFAAAMLGFFGSARATLLTGTLDYGSGAPVTGTLTLTPSARMNVLSTGSCGGPSSIVPQNPTQITITGGAVPGGAHVVGNDCVAPSLTYYLAQLVDNTGVVVIAENWRITGAVVDLSGILPVIAPTSQPLNLNGDVTGDVTQSFVARLQGWPLTLTGNNEPGEGNIILFHDGSWVPGTSAGIGTVTSVALTAPGEFSVAGSPILGAGTLALTWANVAPNLGLFGPTSGPNSAPTFRAMVAGDVPALPESKITNLPADLAALVPKTTQVIAGSGLSGGGDLSADRTLAIAAGGVQDSMIASAPTALNTPSTIVERDGSGNFAAGTITGALTGNATNVSGIVSTSHGGTGGSSAAAGFNNLSPMTTTGDIEVEVGAGTAARLGGVTGAQTKFLASTGTGSLATAPTWNLLSSGDIPAIPESGVTNLVSDLAGKVPTSRAISGSGGISGGGTLGGDVTLTLSPCVASGGSHAPGGVPDPGSSAGTSRFLREDCSFAPPQVAESQVTGLVSDLAGKVATSRQILATAPLAGGGNLGGDLTLTVAPFVGSGVSHAPGVVPDPGVTPGTTRFLREDASFAAPQIAESQVTGLVSDLAGKVPTTTTVSTTGPLTGGGALSGNLSLGISNFVASGAGHAAGAVPDPGASGGTAKFLREDATWAAPAGVGTVTSVGLVVPNIFTNTGGPITTAGTITVGWEDEPVNQVLAGPASGSPGAPAFRALVANDIPQLPESKITNLVSDLAALVPKATLINTTAPLTGGGDLSGNLTLGVSLFTNSTAGTVGASGGGSINFLRADNTFQPVVTSVGLSMPGEFSVASSPVTTSGTIAVTKANQNANLVYAGPNTGAAAAPAFRGLVALDMPTGIPEANIANLTTDLAGKVPTARLINTSSPLTGGGDLTADRTLGLGTVGYSNGGTNATTALGAMNNLGAQRTITTTAPLTGTGTLGADLTIAIPAATNSVNGYLSSADWTTFNAKVGTSRTINTTSPLTGGGTLAGDLTLGLDLTNIVPTSRQVIAGTGLSGGGALSGDVTLSMANVGTPLSGCGDSTHVCAISTNARGQVTVGTPIAVSGGGGGGGTVTAIACGTGLSCSPTTIINSGTISGIPFGASNPGIVPASGGSTSNFLRADGTWTSISSAVVTSLNSQTGAVNLTSTDGSVTITPTGSNIDLSAGAGTFVTTNTNQIVPATGTKTWQGTQLFSTTGGSDPVAVQQAFGSTGNPASGFAAAEIGVFADMHRNVTAATNASPIVITTASGFGGSLLTNDSVVVSSVGGNTAANGTWVITKVDDTHYSLNGSTGNGSYTSGGVFTVLMATDSQATHLNSTGLEINVGTNVTGTNATTALSIGGELGATYWNNGIVFDPQSIAPSGIGIDFNPLGAASAVPIRLANATAIKGRNAVNAADVTLFGISSGDKPTVGADEYPVADGTAGQALETDGAGHVTFQTPLTVIGSGSTVAPTNEIQINNGNFLTNVGGGIVSVEDVVGRITTAGTQSISDSTDTAVTFGTVLSLAHLTQTGANDITIPTGGAGIYYVEAEAAWTSNATGYRLLSIQQNGSEIEGDTKNAVSGVKTTSRASGLIQLFDGDVITVHVTQTSGGALSFLGGSPALRLVRVG